MFLTGVYTTFEKKRRYIQYSVSPLQYGDIVLLVVGSSGLQLIARRG